MRKIILQAIALLFLVSCFSVSYGQQMVTLEPVSASPEEPIKIIFDASQGNKELVGASSVYLHSGVVTDKPDGTDWTYVVGNWGQDDGVGKMTKVTGSMDKWEITLSPTARDYYKVPVGTNMFRLAMVFRTAEGNSSKKATIVPGTYTWGTVTSGGDIYVDLSAGPYVYITAPVTSEVYVLKGSTFTIKAEASADVTSMAIQIQENGVFVEKHKVTSGKLIEYAYAPAVSGDIMYKVVATIGGKQVESAKTVKAIVREATVVADLPVGIKKGINYHPQDSTKATLVLEAPLKEFVYVVGDFNNWEPRNEYLMNKTSDGKLFWYELTGLEPGKEYVFQYWVDGTSKVGDPYAEKVADPWNDQYIPDTKYPNLPFYNKTAYGVASVLQTNQQPYVWAPSEAEWVKPAKEKLVIYEVLVRDFLSSQSYKDLTDTLPYLKRLGVNAIELMPIMEFEGNNSWGYNPMFFFAPDKNYGTKDALKKFIETAHKEGIAVILDMVLNHAFGQNPMVKMYWDPLTNKISTNSPWFNVEATHPFNVGYDFNHESAYTKAFVDSVNHYWLNEYHFDGYRFDLSKGFTQTKSTDVPSWNTYDASRVALLKRMADKIWSHSPNAYVILEHLGENGEEKELAAHGMMLWGAMNHNYNQNTMGKGGSGSSVNWVYHKTRGWNVPHVVGYMESHDEERLVYRNIKEGAVSGSYSTRDLATALHRVHGAGLLFYTVPGPKMLWQFGELGYDYSINRCEDGTINNNCRVSPKPVTWEYTDIAEREKLYTYTADLLKLRNEYSVFTTGEAIFEGNDILQKQLTLKNKVTTSTPANKDEMSAKVVVNFGLSNSEMQVTFPHTGTWYEYYNGGKALQVSSASVTMTLAPGEYRMYTDYLIQTPLSTTMKIHQNIGISLYPNPTENSIFLELGKGTVQSLKMRTMHGAEVTPVRLGNNQWDISNLAPGMYIADVKVADNYYYFKVVKK